jgi:phage protein D
MTGYPFYAPDFSVKIAGLTLAADVRTAVLSLTYDNNIDTADMFTFQLNNADLRFTDSALFDAGKSVEIHMGYAGKLQPMMLGEITAVSPSFPESGAPSMTVSGYDKSHRLRHNSPPHKTYKDISDSRIAARIAVENRLIPVLDPVRTVRKQVNQIGSDWALLQELADRNHFQLFVRWDKLYFRYPRPQVQMAVLEWGKNLNSFNPRLSTAGQVGIQEIRGYDYELAQAIVAVVPVLALDTDLDNIIERLGSGFVNQLIGLGRYVNCYARVSDYFDALTFAKSILMQILEGLYEGSGSCIGMVELQAGDQIEIRGVGKRFSGKYRLSRVTHTIDGNGFRTNFEVTQKASGLLLQSLRKKLMDTPAPNKQPKIEGGIKVGIVRNNQGDPQNLGRVQVGFPGCSDANLSDWARVASFMAGGGDEVSGSWGNSFLPDIGDEVLVAFEQGDVHQPVIVGSLWNGKAPPPETNEGKNARKMLKTKSGMQILFDETEDHEHLSIRDKAGNTIQLNSESGHESIALKDKAGSLIKMDTTSGDIAINHKDGSAITLKPKGSISILAPGGIELISTNGDISLEANNVKVNVTGIMDVNKGAS